MSRLQQLIKELCPNGVEYKRLDEVADITMGTSPKGDTISSDPSAGIEFHQGKTHFGDLVLNCSGMYTSAPVKMAEPGSIVMSVRAPVGDTNITDRKIAIGRGLCAIFAKSIVETKFIYYCLNSYINNIKRMATGATFEAINTNDVKSIKIPFPPLPIQQEIVRILDSFTDLIKELNAELDARRKQYESYRDLLLKFDDNVKWVRLGDIAEIGTGSSNTNEELENGKYPFFVRSQEVRYKNDYEFDETAIITSGDGVGVGKVFHYVEGKYALHQRAYRICIIDKRVLPKYFFYYMKNAFLSYIKRNAVYASVTSVRKHMLENFPVPVPSLEEQQHIVDILDRFDTLINDPNIGIPAEIEARQKQYEYYRDKLLDFKEVAS